MNNKVIERPTHLLSLPLAQAAGFCVNDLFAMIAACCNYFSA